MSSGLRELEGQVYILKPEEKIFNILHALLLIDLDSTYNNGSRSSFKNLMKSMYATNLLLDRHDWGEENSWLPRERTQEALTVRRNRWYKLDEQFRDRPGPLRSDYSRCYGCFFFTQHHSHQSRDLHAVCNEKGSVLTYVTDNTLIYPQWSVYFSADHKNETVLQNLLKTRCLSHRWDNPSRTCAVNEEIHEEYVVYLS